jgi:hypothetical protein
MSTWGEEKKPNRSVGYNNSPCWRSSMLIKSKIGSRRKSSNYMQRHVSCWIMLSRQKRQREREIIFCQTCIRRDVSLSPLPLIWRRRRKHALSFIQLCWRWDRIWSVKSSDVIGLIKNLKTILTNKEQERTPPWLQIRLRTVLKKISFLSLSPDDLWWSTSCQTVSSPNEDKDRASHWFFCRSFADVTDIWPISNLRDEHS